MFQAKESEQKPCKSQLGCMLTFLEEVIFLYVDITVCWSPQALSSLKEKVFSGHGKYLVLAFILTSQQAVALMCFYLQYDFRKNTFPPLLVYTLWCSVITLDPRCLKEIFFSDTIPQLPWHNQT